MFFNLNIQVPVPQWQWHLPPPSILQKYKQPAALAQTVAVLVQRGQQKLAEIAGGHWHGNVIVVLILLGVSIVALALWIYHCSWKSSSSIATEQKSHHQSSCNVGLTADTKSLPWVGRPEKIARWVLPNTRARLWNMINYERALKEAYEKVSLDSSLNPEMDLGVQFFVSLHRSPFRGCSILSPCLIPSSHAYRVFGTCYFQGLDSHCEVVCSVYAVPRPRAFSHGRGERQCFAYQKKQRKKKYDKA